MQPASLVAVDRPSERCGTRRNVGARQCRALVVDDDESFWAAVRAALRDVDTEIVATGEEALRVLRARGDIDVLITSLDLPGRYDGLALARQACALRPGIRILYTSDYRDVLPEDDLRVYHGRLLHKPLSQTELRAAVAEACAA